jgi:hypothetical protein
MDVHSEQSFKRFDKSIRAIEQKVKKCGICEMPLCDEWPGDDMISFIILTFMLIISRDVGSIFKLPDVVPLWR